MRNIQFTPEGFDQFISWANEDKKLFQRLARLIDETRRNPFIGIGKPEPLKGNLAGYWSRRITDEHRLVYRTTDEMLLIIACRGHY